LAGRGTHNGQNEIEGNEKFELHLIRFSGKENVSDAKRLPLLQLYLPLPTLSPIKAGFAISDHDTDRDLWDLRGTVMVTVNGAFQSDLIGACKGAGTGEGNASGNRSARESFWATRFCDSGHAPPKKR
jgi:hypothetical protein